MLVSSELTSRLLKKAVHADPALANDAQRLSELSRRAMRSPETLVSDDEDRAFLMLDRVVQRARQEIDDELDALYYESEAEGASGAPRRPENRMPKTRALLERCLALDGRCYDARTLDTLVRCETSDGAIAELDRFEPEARAWCTERSNLYDGPVADPWDAVFLRPWLRIKARAIDLLVQASCYREARRRCEEMLAFAPTDGQGIRHTLALRLRAARGRGGSGEARLLLRARGKLLDARRAIGFAVQARAHGRRAQGGLRPRGAVPRRGVLPRQPRPTSLPTCPTARSTRPAASRSRSLRPTRPTSSWSTRPSLSPGRSR